MDICLIFNTKQKIHRLSILFHYGFLQYISIFLYSFRILMFLITTLQNRHFPVESSAAHCTVNNWRHPRKPCSPSCNFWLWYPFFPPISSFLFLRRRSFSHKMNVFWLSVHEAISLLIFENIKALRLLRIWHQDMFLEMIIEFLNEWK